MTRSQPSSKLSPRELANQKIQIRKQQEKLLSDLLTVVDALDRAAEHWQQAEQNQLKTISTNHPRNSLFGWQYLQRSWQKWFGVSATAEALPQVVTSAREGIDLIRDTLLSVLSQHEVSVLSAKGQPFDPTQMHALGQQINDALTPNTVAQEIVRGYRWKDRILREAQVIVAVASEPDSDAC